MMYSPLCGHIGAGVVMDGAASDTRWSSDVCDWHAVYHATCGRSNGNAFRLVARVLE